MKGVRVGDRGRVPFALVAVVLLVGSATLATSLRGRPPGGSDPDVDRAVDRTESATRTAIAAATERAARAAARDPVVDPANTTYGRVLDPDRAFRDYLELRVYLSTRRALSSSGQRVRDATTTVSLPPVENASAARRAIDRVTVRRNGSGLRVTVHNVTLRAARGGRTVVDERRTFEVAVDSPVLAVHDRVQRFERRLNRGPLEGPGFGRRLTGRLYAVVWARGYAQFGGAPIANVLANRHVELMTNGALLEEQARTFGRADPSGESALRRAAVEAGLSDLLAAADLRTDWAEYVLGTDPRPPGGAAPPDPDPVSAVGDAAVSATDTPAVGAAAPGPNDTVSVGINATADVAFVGLLRGDLGWNRSLEASLERRYAARARLVAAVERVDGARPEPPVPGERWELARTEWSVDRTVRAGDGPRPAVPDGWHRHETYTRRVTERWTVTGVWTDGTGATRRTTARSTVTHRVGVSVVDEHVPARVPDHRIAIRHERGGPLEGRNLADTPERAVRRLVDDRGGPDTLARRAVAGDLDESAVHLPGAPPANLTDWVYADLADLRERVRGVAVEVPRGELVTELDVDGRLTERFDRRRSALLDAPERYRSVADKVRVAARAAYLRAVRERLDRRTTAASRTRSGLNETVSERTAFTLDELGDLAATADGEVRDNGEVLERPRLTVDASPTYLTLDAVTGRRVPSVRSGAEFDPLVARNVNLFAVPYDDVSDGVTDAVFEESSTETTSFRTAAGALRRAERIGSAVGNESLERRRATLASAVEKRSAPIETLAAVAVARATDQNLSVATDTVGAGLSRWESPGARALAMANGTAATAIAAAAERRSNLDDRTADELAVRLRIALRRARSTGGTLPGATFRTRVDEGVVNTTTEAARSIARREVERIVNEGTERATKRVQKRWVDEVGSSTLFAGLPVLPTLSPWYATTNVWYVTVRGEYARFTVRSRAGAPTATLVYSRDGRPVTLDVDGDGEADRLGSAERVAFEQDVAVVIAVPPGKFGVGERDGDADERSEGWPTAGSDPAANDSHKPARSLGSGEGMFHEQRTSVPDSVDALRREYADDLAAAVESVGVERAVERSGLDRETVEAVADGDLPDLTLAQAGAVQSLATDLDAETTVEMACDHLLLGMSMAVIGVDRLATGADLDLDPKEIQQKVERRAPMSFEEYLTLQHYIVSEQ